MLVKVKVHSCSSLKWGKVSSFAFSGINMELKNRRSHLELFYRQRQKGLREMTYLFYIHLYVKLFFILTCIYKKNHRSPYG